MSHSPGRRFATGGAQTIGETPRPLSPNKPQRLRLSCVRNTDYPKQRPWVLGGYILTCNVNVAQIKAHFFWQLSRMIRPRWMRSVPQPPANGGSNSRINTRTEKHQGAFDRGKKRWLNTRAPLLNAERSIGKELSSLVFECIIGIPKGSGV
jgi:hypothetical protein